MTLEFAQVVAKLIETVTFIGEMELQTICDFLDKQAAPVERVRRDLIRGLNEPNKGRRGLTASQTLRALVDAPEELGLSRAA
jgi:hypothetical protein